jgi:hypothetical protein
MMVSPWSAESSAIEAKASSRCECAWATLAEMPEAPECRPAVSERAAVLLGSEVVPHLLFELSLLLLGEGLLVCLFLLGMTIVIAAESSESADSSVAAPLASPPATSSVLLTHLTGFSNGGSLRDWTFRRLCTFSAHFKHANEVTKSIDPPSQNSGRQISLSRHSDDQSTYKSRSVLCWHPYSLIRDWHKRRVHIHPHDTRWRCTSLCCDTFAPNSRDSTRQNSSLFKQINHSPLLAEPKIFYSCSIFETAQAESDWRGS